MAFDHRFPLLCVNGIWDSQPNPTQLPVCNMVSIASHGGVLSSGVFLWGREDLSPSPGVSTCFAQSVSSDLQQWYLCVDPLKWIEPWKGVQIWQSLLQPNASLYWSSLLLPHVASTFCPPMPCSTLPSFCPWHGLICDGRHLLSVTAWTRLLATCSHTRPHAPACHICNSQKVHYATGTVFLELGIGAVTFKDWGKLQPYGKMLRVSLGKWLWWWGTFSLLWEGPSQ